MVRVQVRVRVGVGGRLGQVWVRDLQVARVRFRNCAAHFGATYISAVGLTDATCSKSKSAIQTM